MSGIIEKTYDELCRLREHESPDAQYLLSVNYNIQGTNDFVFLCIGGKAAIENAQMAVSSSCNILYTG